MLEEWPSDQPDELDRTLFASELVLIGAFHVAPDHPRFHDSGAIRRHLFAFPREPVWIAHQDGEPFLADLSTVAFYNQGQLYRRDAASPQGDRSDWFAIAPAVARDAVERHDPCVADRPARPFEFQRVQSDPRTYARQRLLVERLRSAAPTDGLAVEETVIELLATLLAGAYARPARGARSRRPSAGRGPAETVRRLLALRFREPLALTDLARHAGVSVFHLCRSFRRATGSTVHAHRLRLRLLAALEEVAAGRDLTDLALDLGFSSHSHFTAAFRSAFGTTPSTFRAAVGRRGGREIGEARRRLGPPSPASTGAGATRGC